MKCSKFSMQNSHLTIFLLYLGGIKWAFQAVLRVDPGILGLAVQHEGLRTWCCLDYAVLGNIRPLCWCSGCFHGCNQKCFENHMLSGTEPGLAAYKPCSLNSLQACYSSFHI